MDNDRWQRISRLYHEALQRSVEQRDAFLEAHCHGDQALRAEVASLLAREASDESLLDKPAAEVLDAPPIQSSEHPHGGLEPGVKLGAYQIERLLGRGGMVPYSWRTTRPSIARWRRVRCGACRPPRRAVKVLDRLSRRPHDSLYQVDSAVDDLMMTFELKRWVNVQARNGRGERRRSL